MEGEGGRRRMERDGGRRGERGGEEGEREGEGGGEMFIFFMILTSDAFFWLIYVVHHYPMPLSRCTCSI